MIIRIITGIIAFGTAIEIYILIFMAFMHHLSNRDIKREREFRKLIREGKIKFNK